MSDWTFMAGIVVALLVTFSLGVRRERNPARPRRGQRPAAGRPSPPEPAESLPTTPPPRR